MSCIEQSAAPLNKVYLASFGVVLSHKRADFLKYFLDLAGHGMIYYRFAQLVAKTRKQKAAKSLYYVFDFRIFDNNAFLFLIKGREIMFRN